MRHKWYDIGVVACRGPARSAHSGVSSRFFYFQPPVKIHRPMSYSFSSSAWSSTPGAFATTADPSGNELPANLASAIAVTSADTSPTALAGTPSRKQPGEEDLSDANKSINGLNGPSKGGRPRDFAWNFFSGDGSRAACNFCDWSTDRPKAFRMRQHILACRNAPPGDKNMIRRIQEAKDHAKEASALANATLTSIHRLTAGMHTSATPQMGNMNPDISTTSVNQFENTPPDDDDDDEDDDEDGSANKKRKNPDGSATISTSALGLRSPITCHVLDANRGRPAVDMKCRLDKFSPNGFILLSSSITDIDGRCHNLMEPSSRVEGGIYKVTFFTGEYFGKLGTNTFFPFIEITFEVKEETSHYHIPLLLSPFSYTTYRGS